jgi:hypothetical protein
VIYLGFCAGINFCGFLLSVFTSDFFTGPEWANFRSTSMRNFQPVFSARNYSAIRVLAGTWQPPANL